MNIPALQTSFADLISAPSGSEHATFDTKAFIGKVSTTVRKQNSSDQSEMKQAIERYGQRMVD